jgi:glycerol-3-phosphate dehydrogenase subunit C
MREGSLEAPTRHPLDWHNPEFYDEAAIDAELRRVFDICHGCRRCFNLCDSFPRLFTLIDESDSGELDGVPSDQFKSVVDACTLCDMCFMTKCPYVPPHEFNLDFPHLMVRYRAAEFKRHERSLVDRELAKTDRNAKLAAPVAGLANWSTRRENHLTRPILEKVMGIDRDAEIPKYHSRSFVARAKQLAPEINANAPARGRKVAIYATCFVNYNSHGIGEATLQVLARNGIAPKVVHPTCCAMPKLENGDLEGVAKAAREVADALLPLVDEGYDILALTPSCALMLKFEWPLILPNEPKIKRLAEATFDIAEYIVDIAKKEGLAEGLKPLPGHVAMHLACHARAQNMGPKAAQMLQLIPSANITVIERCSGHGGKWGMMKENFDTAIKVGKPAARQAIASEASFVSSECPLAADHLAQGIEKISADDKPARTYHPIELFAKAYGF